MEFEKRRMHLDNARLRNPYEIPLYIFSVLVNLLIIALILAGALLLGYVNALVGEPLSGPMVNVIVAAFVALLLLVPWPGRVSPTHPRRHKGIGGEALAPAIPRHLRREGPLRAQAGAAKGSGDLLDVR